MIGALIFNIIAVFFAWLESAKIYKHGLKLSLFTVFLFLALRYDYGNDYRNYLELFKDVNIHSSYNFDFSSLKGFEIGWIFLNRLFRPLGFFAMIAFLAAFTSIILFRFINKYVPPQYFWFAVFFYVFSPEKLLTLSSAMRQEVSVILFIFSIEFIIQKKVWQYIIIIFIASLFHTSAFFLFPLIFLGFINFRIKFRHIPIFLAIFIVPLSFKSDVYSTVVKYTDLYMPYYYGYTDLTVTDISLSLGFALSIIFYLLMVYFAQKDTDRNHNILYNIFIISVLLIPINFIVNLMGRLNFYLLPVMIAVYPIIFNRIKNNEFRRGFIIAVIILTIYAFFGFFQLGVWESAFGEYNTIFSAP